MSDRLREDASAASAVGRRQRGAVRLQGPRSQAARALERRKDPGALLSFLLAITVHVALVTVLVFGVRWRTKPEPVMAELWTQLPPVEVPRAEPPKPPPVVKPEPKPAPKPEPKVEPKPPPKPDIALEQERKRKEDEARKRKEEEARKRREEAERKRQEELRAKEERERRERELAEKRQIEQETRERLERELNRELAAAPKAAAGPPRLGDPKVRAQWADRIRAKIRSNIVLPPDLAGNPEAVFDVELLPSGDVLTAKLRKSSGVKIYDDAVERAIYKSSPLPLPERGEAFERRLELRFRPKD
jgi:colicin import membrane protein